MNAELVGAFVDRNVSVISRRYPYVHTPLLKDTHTDYGLGPPGGFVMRMMRADSRDSPVYLVSGGKALPVLFHKINVLRGVVERPFVGQQPVQGAPGPVAGEAGGGSGCCGRPAETHPAVKAEADEAP